MTESRPQPDRLCQFLSCIKNVNEIQFLQVRLRTSSQALEACIALVDEIGKKSCPDFSDVSQMFSPMISDIEKLRSEIWRFRQSLDRD